MTIETIYVQYINLGHIMGLLMFIFLLSQYVLFIIHHELLLELIR